MGLCSLAQIRAQLLRNRLETCTTAVPSSSGGWVQLFLMHPLPSAALSNHNRVTLTEEACKVTICELVRFALNEGFPNYSLRSFRSMRVKWSSEHMAWPLFYQSSCSDLVYIWEISRRFWEAKRILLLKTECLKSTLVILDLAYPYLRGA